jgi:hypothetical protein
MKKYPSNNSLLTGLPTGDLFNGAFEDKRSIVLILERWGSQDTTPLQNIHTDAKFRLENGQNRAQHLSAHVQAPMKKKETRVKLKFKKRKKWDLAKFGPLKTVF